MKCRTCGNEIVFVRSNDPRSDASAPVSYSAHHRGVNLHDADVFGAGARVEDPSVSTQYRLRRELEADCCEVVD